MSSTPHRNVGLFGLALMALLTGGTLAAAEPAPRSAPACIEVVAEARYKAYGYDHIVHVGNHCASAAVCDVSTNVNPSPERVTIPAKEAVEVLTFRGSPSREFVPRVDCTLSPS